MMQIKKKKVKRVESRVVVAAMAAPTKRRRTTLTTTRARQGGQNSGPNNFAREYARTLEDPFEYGPLKLGFNCFVPTVQATAYLRGSITVNAIDGTFALVTMPDIQNIVLSTNNGGSSNVWNLLAAQNQSAINNQTDAARLVSGGLRAFALFPATSMPGVMFAGTIPSVTRAQIVQQGSNYYTGLSTSEIGPGTTGARVTIRPLDSNSFNFTPYIANGYAAGVLVDSSVAFIAGTGFPAGTVIWYEAVLNLEMLPAVQQQGIGVNDNAVPEATPSDYFASPQQLYNAVRPLLQNAAVMDAAVGAASVIHPGLGYALSSVRSVFGSGSNIRNMVAGRSSSRHSRQLDGVMESWHRV